MSDCKLEDLRYNVVLDASARVNSEGDPDGAEIQKTLRESVEAWEPAERPYTCICCYRHFKVWQQALNHLSEEDGDA